MQGSENPFRQLMAFLNGPAQICKRDWSLVRVWFRQALQHSHIAPLALADVAEPRPDFRIIAGLGTSRNRAEVLGLCPCLLPSQIP
jgi:hypothetical protein